MKINATKSIYDRERYNGRDTVIVYLYPADRMGRYITVSMAIDVHDGEDKYKAKELFITGLKENGDLSEIEHTEFKMSGTLGGPLTISFTYKEAKFKFDNISFGSDNRK